MKAKVFNSHTVITPTKEETETECKIGQGAETCILLTVSGDGFECHAKNKMPILTLIERARKGETSAQREGCDRVNNWQVPTWETYPANGFTEHDILPFTALSEYPEGSLAAQMQEAGDALRELGRVARWIAQRLERILNGRTS